MAQVSQAQPPRIDSWEKVSGGATFVEDIPELSGSVYAAPVKSPYAHARIGEIDASRALALPGVLGVLHRDNLGEFGLSLDILPGLYAGVTGSLRPLFSSSLTLATVIAVVLNQLLRLRGPSVEAPASSPAH